MLCSHLNRLIKAILMSTNNIQFSISIRKITLMRTHNIPFSIQKRNSLYIILNQQLWDFFKGLQNEFETAVCLVHSKWPNSMKFTVQVFRSLTEVDILIRLLFSEFLLFLLCCCFTSTVNI